jgi:hypothetical protein
MREVALAGVIGLLIVVSLSGCGASEVTAQEIEVAQDLCKTHGGVSSVAVEAAAGLSPLRYVTGVCMDEVKATKTIESKR